MMALDRQAVVPIVLAAAVPLAVVVALAFGHSPVMAAVGAALVIVYWLLQRWFTKIGMRGSVIQSAAVAVGGVAVRMMLVIIVLVAIALTDRTGFLTAAITFLSVFALYYVVNYALVVR
jgi:hypothetical protein